MILAETIDDLCVLKICNIILATVRTRIDRGRFIPFSTFLLMVYSRSRSTQEVGLFS